MKIDVIFKLDPPLSENHLRKLSDAFFSIIPQERYLFTMAISYVVEEGHSLSIDNSLYIIVIICFIEKVREVQLRRFFVMGRENEGISRQVLDL